MVSTTTRVDPGSDPPKSTLFCPECAHQSHVEGDWMLRTRGGRLAYICPDCGTSITERPVGSDAPVLDSPNERVAGALGRFVVASSAVWRESIVVFATTASSTVRNET